MLRHLLRSEQGAEQGAAATELALSALLFLPAIFYAIFVGEAFEVAIKAQEGEIAAGWEITAHRLHDFQNGGSAQSLVGQAATEAQQQVFSQLQDFDSFADTGRNQFQHLIGLATFTSLKCASRQDNKGDEFKAQHESTYLHEDGWAACEANVEYKRNKFAENVHKEWFPTVKLFPQDVTDIKMCGVGRDGSSAAKIGSDLAGCKGTKERGFLVFTDEWGLEKPDPEPVGSNGGGNKGYWNVGNSLWNGLPVTTSLALVTPACLATVGLSDQGDTDSFKMGYLKNIEETRSFDNDGGNMTLHLTPDHEASSTATNNTQNLSRLAYQNTRHADHYMAFKDEDANYP